ncbi:uncharacterized membrane protein-like protein [Tanacetum coccineum]
MSSRFPSHQLNNGLYVSGRPEQPKERTPTMSSTAVPYTGGDIKKSGELGKMFDVDNATSRPRKSGPIASAPLRQGSFGGNSNQTSSNSANRMGTSGAGPGSSSMKKASSGPLNKHGEPIRKSSGPQGGGLPASRHNSGPIPPVLPTTGLITSGPLNSAGAPRKGSGQTESTGQGKTRTTMAKNQAVTYLRKEPGGSFSSSAFSCWGRKSLIDFIDGYPDAELRTAKNGQFVKVSGVVTWGKCSLESSFKRVSDALFIHPPVYMNIEDGVQNLPTPHIVALPGVCERWRYIKEGSTVSVMGIVQRHNNVLMIVPPSESVPTGCQWTRCLLPMSLEGIVLRCEDSSKLDVIPV